MPQVRVLSPKNGVPINCFGRIYTPTAGAIVDCPAQDAEMLIVNGWLAIGQSGPTSARPTAFPFTMYSAQTAGILASHYLDTTLGLWVLWDGITWRNPVNGAAV